MAQESPAPPDEKEPKPYPQKDGWGVSLFFQVSHGEVAQLMDSLSLLFCSENVQYEQHASLAPGLWLFLTSLQPVWDQAEMLATKLESAQLSPAKLLLHARAAHKEIEVGNIQQNMPFMIRVGDEILSFAFNGLFRLHSPNQFFALLDLQNLKFEKEKNGAQRLAKVFARLMRQEQTKQPDLSLSDICRISLEKLCDALTETDPTTDKKIATITGCNIVIQGETFTHALSVPRDMDHKPGNEQYYTMHPSEDESSVASSPLENMRGATPIGTGAVTILHG